MVIWDIMEISKQQNQSSLKLGCFPNCIRIDAKPLIECIYEIFVSRKPRQMMSSGDLEIPYFVTHFGFNLAFSLDGYRERFDEIFRFWSSLT
jgi:hypothetical protein